MKHSVVVDHSQKARNALSGRIARISFLQKRIAESQLQSKGSLSTEVWKAIGLGMLLLVVGIFSPSIVSGICTSMYLGEGAMAFGLIATYSVATFLALYLIKLINNCCKISKINGYIYGLDTIKKSITTELSKIDAIVGSLEKGIIVQNIHFTSMRDIDGEISQYEKITSSYDQDRKSAIDWLLILMFWISTILFGAAFVLFAGRAFSNFLSDQMDLAIDGVALVAIALASIAAYVLMNVFITKGKKYSFGYFLLALLCGPAGLIAAAIVIVAIYALIQLIIGIVKAIVGLIAVLIVGGVVAGCIAGGAGGGGGSSSGSNS